MNPKLRALLRQGERSLRLGKLQAAEAVYREAVETFPDSAEAWLGLSQAITAEPERSQALQRAQALDPTVASEMAPMATDPVPPSPSESTVSPLDAALAESQSWLEQTTMTTTTAMEPAVVDPSVETVATPVVEADPIPAAEEEMLVCHFHPNTETALRCNRCSKPICTRCARKTPVGYRCRECIKEQQEVFYSVVWYDYLLAAVVALPLAVIAGYIVPGIGWLTIFVAPFAGGIIAEAVRLVVRRRRGRWLPLLVGACVVLGSLPVLVPSLIAIFVAPSSVFGIIWVVVYLAMAASSAYYRVK